jgi:hypothetical protein
MSEGTMGQREREVEIILTDIAEKNKDTLDSAKIVPLSPEWPFCTNGLYLLLATAGCGKSRFILKHMLMCDKLAGQSKHYYNLIVYCSTSGELDQTVQTFLDAKKIKTPLVQINDDSLMTWLARHLKRKKKYYAMIKYLRKKIINKTLQHSVDKYKLKFWKPDPTRQPAPEIFDILPQYAGSGRSANDAQMLYMKEVVNKPKLLSFILKKISQYGVSRAVLPLLVILDDFAGHKLIERKETPLAKMMTKCRHYSCTFIIAVQTPKYVIKNIRRQATDVVVWLGLTQEDFFELFKEISYSYDVDALWQEYKSMPTQTSHLILNLKAHQYRFIVVETK